jgi:tetratricopeptide (TPR) repeat protein
MKQIPRTSCIRESDSPSSENPASSSGEALEREGARSLPFLKQRKRFNSDNEQPDNPTAAISSIPEPEDYESWVSIWFRKVFPPGRTWDPDLENEPVLLSMAADAEDRQAPQQSSKFLRGSRYAIAILILVISSFLGVCVFLSYQSMSSGALGQSRDVQNERDGDLLLKDVSASFGKEDFGGEDLLKKIKKLRALRPNDARTYQMEGAYFALRGDYAAARASFQRSVELDPQSEVHRFNLAEAEFMAGNYVEAGKLFRHARSLFPKANLFRFRIYLCEILQGQKSEAADFLASLPNTSASAEMHFILVLEALQNGDSEMARKLIGTAGLLYKDEVKDYEKTLRRVGLYP